MRARPADPRPASAAGGGAGSARHGAEAEHECCLAAFAELIIAPAQRDVPSHRLLAAAAAAAAARGVVVLVLECTSPPAPAALWAGSVLHPTGIP